MTDLPEISGQRVVGFDPIVIKGDKGDPGVLILNQGDPIPAGTPSGTIIFRRS